MDAALLLIFLAGLADGLGTQSVVLFANQVGRRSFVGNLLVSGLFSLLGALCWALSIGLVVRSTLGIAIAPPALMVLVSMGYVPLLFSFLALIPYGGPGIAALLNGASFVIVAAQLADTLAIAPWQALACAVGGWLLLQAARRVLSRPLALADRQIWTLTTHQAERRTLEEILDHLALLDPEPPERRAP
ncbi:MAG: hypothetical protein WCJ55_03690 [Chloroflexales bacterium]